VWATDRDLRITATAGARGPAEGRDVVGMRLEDLFGAEDGALHLAMHRQALAGGAVAYGWPQGARCFRCSLDVARDEGGRILGVVGVAVDETEREREHARLAEAELRLRTAQKVGHVGSWERDLDHDATIWSDEVARIYGFDPENFDGSWAAQLARCHPDDRARVEEALVLVTSRPGPVELDFRVFRADGAVRIVRVQMEALGRRRVAGAARDVTKEKAAEHGLKTTLSLLEATLESTADGLLVVDLEGKIVRHNAKFASVWRIPSDVLAARDDGRALAFVMDELIDPEGFSARVRAVYAEPESESYDEVRLADGRILWRYSQAQRLDGKPVGRVWSFRDITDTRRAQAARDRALEAERAARETAQTAAARAALLAEASRLLTSLDHESALDSLAQLATRWFAYSCAVDLVEPDGSVRRVAWAPYGAGPTASGAAPPAKSWVDEYEDYAVLGVPLAVTGQMIGTIRFARKRPQGFDASDLTLAEDLAGRASLASGIAHVYRQTKEALRARDEFLSVASHELRTPLATLQATTDALLAGAYGGVPPGSPLAEPVQSIARQVGRLSRLANQILDALAISSTGIELQLAEADLSSIAAEVVARLAPRSPTKAQIELAAPCPVPGCWDRARLDQVIEALVANALRFGANRPIAVSVERRDDRALLTVRDHGIGIPGEQLRSLFERFDRAGASRGWGGLGLGLYVSRAIVERHGGTIRVESKPGGGTTFFVELPLSARAACP
jgi:PAS domain S-box-containing protein